MLSTKFGFSLSMLPKCLPSELSSRSVDLKVDLGKIGLGTVLGCVDSVVDVVVEVEINSVVVVDVVVVVD